MNSDQSSTSTTDTLSQWKPAGSQAVLTAGIVTVSLSAHAFLHVSMLTGIVVAVALLRSQTLVPAALGALYGALIAVCGLIYVPLKREHPTEYFTTALANITNAMASRPLIRVESKTGGSQPGPEPGTAPALVLAPELGLSPLPPAVGAARRVEEHVYWQLVHDRMPASVPPKPRGRHVRREADAAGMTNDLAEGSSTGQREPGTMPADEHAATTIQRTAGRSVIPVTS